MAPVDACATPQLHSTAAQCGGTLPAATQPALGFPPPLGSPPALQDYNPRRRSAGSEHMQRSDFFRIALALAGAYALSACTQSTMSRDSRAASSVVAEQSAATFSVPAAALTTPIVLIAYGDMRFTNPAETSASSPV